MAQVEKQPSKFPTRKILAVILSGMILGICQSLLRLVWPDHPFAPYMEDADIWLQGLIMVIAGYMTQEKTKNVESAKPLQGADAKSVDDSSDQLSFDQLWTEKEETGGDGSGTKDASTGLLKAGEGS